MNESKHSPLRFPALLLALALALAGCASRKPRLGTLPAASTFPVVPTAEPYRIQAGDELEIRFFHTPELNVTLPVRPDGLISLPLAYELTAAGRTVDELRRDIVERCSRELAQPEVAVIVRAFAGYVVHVGGEVDKPGVLSLNGPRTVLEAVFAAGGFLPSASPEDVFVVRRTDTGYELLGADMEAVLDGSSGAGNLALRPYDVVFVPPSRIADVNKWVDQYIRQNIPISFSYRLDSTN